MREAVCPVAVTPRAWIAKAGRWLLNFPLCECMNEVEGDMVSGSVVFHRYLCLSSW